ncbi:MAG: hypothetical protein RBS85_08195 [Methanofastidiosum sp.]|jgi:hypothetical protein|nr:hypothetical protein [Methanofastidiosum sp.]
MISPKSFIAYPGNPPVIGQSIENAIKSNPNASSWKALDIYGHFISEEVIRGINNCDLFIADISVLNLNVTYEIGYAIGRGKRVLLTKNSSIKEVEPFIREVGIFDTIGFSQYENSRQLSTIIKDSESKSPLKISFPINTKAPVYLIDIKHKSDWATRIVSRIKKSGYIFRSFDPNESPRLSAYDAISQVASSYGVVVPLLASSFETFSIHNMRASFIAGLSDGMEKATCIIQSGDDPVPLDYRDFVNVTYDPSDVDKHIAKFASRVATAFQKGDTYKKNKTISFLQSLDLGASTAENEMKTLDNYYLRTDQFLKSLRGENHLCVGRKGSGKSAIFLQIRDLERSRDRSQNIVLDLKPEGYKLVKFKELVLSFLEEGTLQHTIMAFWEYVLLLEICHKLLQKDQHRHLTNHELFEPYKKLSELYDETNYDTEGDFSERITGLIGKIHNDYQNKYGGKDNVRLSSAQITELLYTHDVKSLKDEVLSYMKHKGVLWLLFDNIDKGWPATGLEHEDLMIIRALIDSTRKIEKQFSKVDIIVKSIIFLRNDVYELLVKETSDRGKEANVMLDWTDPDLLRELVRLRIISNDLDENIPFASVWLQVCTSHYKGEESSQYLIDRSLMRPRFLLNLINQCKSFAVNLNHSVIEQDDIEKGLEAYSSDLLADIHYEIDDIAPGSGESLYAFIGCQQILHHTDVGNLLYDFGIEKDLAKKIIKILLWYGFLGLQVEANETKYIYNFNYNMRLMNGFAKKKKDNLFYQINPAFWPALLIEGV